MLAQRRAQLERAGGALYGVWRSQIGRPRDELTAMTAWSRHVGAAQAMAALLDGIEHVQGATTQAMAATLRPMQPDPPTRQGNYAFRWFITPEQDWRAFLDLCAQAWPGFEAAYDSQVIGLWQSTGDISGSVDDAATAPVPAAMFVVSC